MIFADVTEALNEAFVLLLVVVGLVIAGGLVLRGPARQTLALSLLSIVLGAALLGTALCVLSRPGARVNTVSVEPWVILSLAVAPCALGFFGVIVWSLKKSPRHRGPPRYHGESESTRRQA